MTGGSVAGVLLVLAWSRVESLAAFYAVWVAIGVVMAMVLYEVAFTVLAKAFPEPGERRRAMTAMTLVAALASFIFLPLSQWLIDAYGWRDALVVLAVVLGVTTVPLHAVALRVPPEETLPRPHAGAAAVPARRGAAVASLLAALDRLLPGLARRDRDDGLLDPVPARARSRRRVRGVRRRAWSACRRCRVACCSDRS